MTLALVHNAAPFEPRRWQPEAREAFLSHTGPTGALVCVATGGGKTAFGHYLAVDFLDRGERVLWLADQKTLVRQPYTTLAKWWPDLVPKAGIVMNTRNGCDAQIVYASKDTLRNEKRMAELLEAGPFGLVVADECHRSVSKTWLKVINGARSEGTRLLGLTATPHREDTRSLSEMWQLVYSYSILDAIADKVLVPPYVAVDAIPGLDLSTVKQSNGDYDQGELGRAMLRAHIVEHTVASMRGMHTVERLPLRDHQKLVSLAGRQVLVHTASVEQARLTAEALTADGWIARYASGETPETELERLFGLFAARKINVLVAANLLSTGVDLPIADATVFASPTRSWTLFVQRLGRGLRAYPGKEDCLVLDLVRCTKDHSIIAAPVLVDGDDCIEGSGGRHAWAVLDSGEGRCLSCGKMVKCGRNGGAHDFKDGACRACGQIQCVNSPDKFHHFVPWTDHKRKCLHCAMEIPDPMAGMLDRSPPQREPVNWQEIAGGPTRAWAVVLEKVGTMYSVEKGEGRYRAFLYARQTLLPLHPGDVDGSMVRLLTDDVARRSEKYRGSYGGAEAAKARISHANAAYMAKKLNVWRE